MAGTIIVDRIESDASYASTINVAGQITFSNTVNFGVFAGTAPVAGFYLPTTNALAFTTASTERMRINSAGGVLVNTVTQTGSTRMVVADATGNGQIRAIHSTGSGLLINQATASGVAYIQQQDNAALAFATNNTEVMRIDSSGNVGIGTSSPDIFSRGYGTTLSVSNTGVSGTSIAINSGTSVYPALELGRGGVRKALFTAQSTVTEFGNLEAVPLVFLTNSTERMRIDSSGNLLLGTTSLSGSERLSVSKDNNGQENIRLINSSSAGPWGMDNYYSAAAPNGTSNFFHNCRDTGGNRFTVRSNGGLANYSGNNANLSDRREKTNFAPATSYLDKICAIPVQTFNYIDQNLEEDAGLTLGVVAQDVQAVAPELVMESNWASRDEPEKMRLSIYQTDLQFALMKCIQEQQVLITALTARITALESN
jgi:hypothetical protein